MSKKNMTWQDLMAEDEGFAREVSKELDRHADSNYITKENWTFL
jgi:hypothetical protein